MPILRIPGFLQVAGLFLSGHAYVMAVEDAGSGIVEEAPVALLGCGNQVGQSGGIDAEVASLTCRLG